jgi:transcriptional regulator with GAF, ATPase, and Fis domain
MALPLKLGDRVIGALDVQSTESNAFSVEDIELFTTLVDQIAIAINNSQLYEETSKALEESQSLYRQYLRQEWTRQTRDVGNRNYKFTPDGLVPFDEEIPEINMVLNTARPIFRTQKSSDDGGETNSVMAVPIILNNEPIGAIYLKESSGTNYVWSQSELSTVQSVADQVAQTLENARLFEQTIRRADRERKVLEITSKIRSTNDPQEMLMITLEELKRNLGVKQAQIVLNMDNQSLPEPTVEGTASSKSTLPEESTTTL